MGDHAVPIDFGQLVEIARSHLYSLFGAGAPVSQHALQGDCLPCINVTLRTRGLVRGSMSGRGHTLQEQLLDAVSRAAKDQRFSGRIVRAEIHHVSIEVWVQISAEPIPPEERVGNGAIELGLHGVEVEQGDHFAYYKPSVALTSRFESAQALFSALCKKAKLPSNSWKLPECALRRTLWRHFCGAPGQQVVQMVALRSHNKAQISKESMVQWALDGAKYLAQNQHIDGSFCYRYLPFTNSAKKGDANPVRESGCAYAVSEASSSIHLIVEPELEQCADRALNAISRRAVKLDEGGMYIADSLKPANGGKLGTSALFLLALLTSRLYKKHERQIEALTTAIKAAQNDDGLFRCTFGDGRETNSQIDFFPGQAILALVIKAQSGDESCRAAYSRAFVPYRDHFHRAPATAFVGWQADAWCRAALLDKNEAYASFVFEQLDWLLQFQVPATQQELYVGGFSRNGKPPNFSSIVFTEAVARGADLAYQVGDSRFSRYRAAFKQGVGFCSRLRLTQDQSAFFPDPLRAIGGITSSITDFGVRSDVVQHAMTLALAALERPMLLEL